MTLLLEARFLPSPGEWIERGGLLVGGGRVLRVLRSRRAVRRASAERRLVLGEDLVVTPGLVNAHAHLELSHLGGKLPAGEAFPKWIQRILAARAEASEGDYAGAFRAGARRALETGTTTIGDIDSVGAACAGAARVAPRIRVYREVLDAQDSSRSAAAARRIRRGFRRREGVLEGVSPHAPLTVSRALAAAVRKVSVRRGLPVTTHWAETAEEELWLRTGKGPWGRFFSGSPGLSGLAVLEEAGLLGPSLSLVHANHPGRGELRRVGESGASVVHCPGSHLFFGRAPFPWRRFREAGIPIALGTDSLASNGDLDMLREMSLARLGAPGLAPEAVLAMATENGARAVGLAGEVGGLFPGARADFVAWRAETADRATFVDSLTRGAAAVSSVWVGGVQRFRAEPPSAHVDCG